MSGLYERIKALEPTVGGGGQYGDGYRDALRAAATLALMQDALVVELVEALKGVVGASEMHAVHLEQAIGRARAVLAKYKGEQP